MWLLVLPLLIMQWCCSLPSSPPVVRHHAIPNSTPATPRRILSCNVRGLPLVNGWGYQDRLESYITRKKSDFDTIVLQEVFLRSARNTVMRSLEDEFNMVWSPSLVVGNGLLIASRYSVRDATAVEFPPCRGPDWFARKGALAATIGDLRLVTTHLQDAEWDASGAVRREELRALGEFCLATAEHALIVGDFNTLPESPLLREVAGMRTVRSGRPTHGEALELDYALAQGSLPWACSLDPDPPPADHRALVLERPDRRATSARVPKADARTSSGASPDPALGGICARASDATRRKGPLASS